ncbi:hypothetical protein PGT21_013898 [Puccinia graminis f. sp. tritici]|uniref:Uncharacterized protein n=1 Tax=Puccinia graminis f. sp. tritici TaxID=56615 RepID=A0A5B0PVD2_PUCGR|nr:hypothetical protein PGT21_013898 [Puccinia graminis f. sp. tritici]KAA1104966.1 hypothetical protein PGTUg99_011604 [Puccinia graminis f. sp. tritici]
MPYGPRSCQPGKDTVSEGRPVNPPIHHDDPPIGFDRPNENRPKSFPCRHSTSQAI